MSGYEIINQLIYCCISMKEISLSANLDWNLLSSEFSKEYWEDRPIIFVMTNG